MFDGRIMHDNYIAIFLFSIQKGWTYYYCFWYVMFLSYGDIIITHRYPKPNVHNHSLSKKKTRSKNIIVSWRKWKLKIIFKMFFEKTWNRIEKHIRNSKNSSNLWWISCRLKKNIAIYIVVFFFSLQKACQYGVPWRTSRSLSTQKPLWVL